MRAGPQGLTPNRTHLEIQVDDVEGVEVLHSIEDLVDDLSSLLFRQRFDGYHSEQLPTSCSMGKKQSFQ